MGTYIGCAVRQGPRASIILDMIRGILQVVSAVIDPFTQTQTALRRGGLPEDWNIRIWGRRTTRWWEILFSCLLEWIRAGIITELSRRVSHVIARPIIDAYARRFIHIDPSTINIESGIRVVEQGKFIGPVAGRPLSTPRHEAYDRYVLLCVRVEPVCENVRSIQSNPMKITNQGRR